MVEDEATTQTRFTAEGFRFSSLLMIPSTLQQFPLNFMYIVSSIYKSESSKKADCLLTSAPSVHLLVCLGTTELDLATAQYYPRL